MLSQARRLSGALLLALLAGCASVDQPARPSGPQPPPDMARRPAGELASERADKSASALESSASHLPASPPGWPTAPDSPRSKALIGPLLPAYVKDKSGWAGDLYAAFLHLKIPQVPETYCAVIAVIEQESTFQVDPVVPRLPDIVWRELEQRGARFGIPRLLIAAAMRKSSPDGRSYQKRIDSLKTERQLNALFNDMIAELPFGRQLLADYNPIHTAGPMQVSIEFAEQHAQQTPYPYPLNGSLRDEVFSRRGGLYFGSAILLDYPAPYNEVVYRFADFNAGRYSSRNAAFQSALGRLAGKKLLLDGDLLRYEKGQPSKRPSTVENTARSLGKQLKISPAGIRRDLLLEKTADFDRSPLFRQVFALAEQAGGRALPRQAMPQIDLKSPKIVRKLTTGWFARRVEGRYRSCLQRAMATL